MSDGESLKLGTEWDLDWDCGGEGIVFVPARDSDGTWRIISIDDGE